MVSAFITEYNLGTTVQGAWRTALAPLMKTLGGLLTLRLVCLGSPLTDKCMLGFAANLSPDRRGEAVRCLLEALEEFAATQSIGLLAAKDIAEEDLGPGVNEALLHAGFCRQPSLPNAVLPLPYPNEEAYLKSLSQGTRRDVRRKLKDVDKVRVQVRRGRDALDLVPDLQCLYDGQRGRSNVDFDQFESLTPAYFRNVLGQAAMNPIVFAYLHDETLVAFNLCYHSERLFIDKFVGFDNAGLGGLNLYVLSWMTNVRYCLEHGIASLQTGQTGYEMKRRLGSVLQSNWIYFRHRNPMVNRALRLASPLLAPDRYDETIAKKPVGGPK